MKQLIFSFLIFSLLISCNENRSNKELSNFISKLPNDTTIIINTYDGGNQVVHPDVLFSNNELKLAITPYPYYKDSLENPCLYRSKDGLNFREYSKGINPLVPTPKIDHNCDPDIIYDQDSNLVMLYLETMRPYSNRVISLTKKKGSDKFEKKTVLYSNLKNKGHLFLSPSVAKSNLQNKYFLYFVDMDAKKYRIKYITSTNLRWFNSRTTRSNKLKFPKNYSPWHLDIITSDDKYYLLTNGYHGNEENHHYSLFLAESSDLIHWKNNREILTAKNIPDPKLKYVYRSTGLITGDTLALWYSYVDKGDVWKLAFKKLKLEK